MDSKFLDLYEEELRFIREMGREFAQSHPKIAGRLDLDSLETTDPYTERLLEGFAFLTARIRLRMASQYPDFTQNLLGLLYPNFIAPTPSAGVFEFKPDFREGALKDGYSVPRGSSLIARAEGIDTACEFVTKSDVILRPLVIDEAEYSDVPSTIQRLIPGAKNLEAVIRLQIRTAADTPLNTISFDPLSFFISGEGAQADYIMRSLCMDAKRILARHVDILATDDLGTEIKLTHDGFDENQALLPISAKTFSGHRLLQEAFILLEKFRFVTLTGLDEALAGSEARVFEVVFGLETADPRLADAVKPEAFKLHCTPAINLFKRRADRILISAGEPEHHVVVDRTRPQDFEVYDILSVQGVDEGSKDRLKFEPVFKSGETEAAKEAHGFFSLRRTERIIKTSTRSSNYLGSNVYIRLSGPSRGPAPAGIDQLIVETLCTNRSLPTLLHVKSKFTLQSTAPLKSVSPIVQPTSPRPQPARDAASWNLINALSLNHLSFAGQGVENVEWLGRLLSLFIDPENEVHRQIIRAYKSLDVQMINRRIPGDGPITYGRGLELTLSADADKLRGTGPFILASVLERFFMRAASINSFTRMALKSSDRTDMSKWPVRAGGRHIL